MRDGFSAHRQRGYEWACCEVIIVRICSSSHNFYVFGVYQNPDLSDKVFDCLLTSIAKVRSVDRKETFVCWRRECSSRGVAWIFYDESAR